jgi:hypothetical protein
VIYKIPSPKLWLTAQSSRLKDFIDLTKRELILCTEKSRQYFNSIPVFALIKSHLAAKNDSIKNGEGIDI